MLAAAFGVAAAAAAGAGLMAALAGAGAAGAGWQGLARRSPGCQLNLTARSTRTSVPVHMAGRGHWSPLRLKSPHSQSGSNGDQRRTCQFGVWRRCQGSQCRGREEDVASVHGYPDTLSMRTQ